MKQKPKIRLSRLQQRFICSGLGCIGSGETFRESWEVWAKQMVITGRARLIPNQGKKYKTN